MQEGGDSCGSGGAKGPRVPTLPVLTVTKEQESLKKNPNIYFFFSFGSDTSHPRGGDKWGHSTSLTHGTHCPTPCNGGSLMQRGPSHRAGGWQGHHLSLSPPCMGRGAGWHDLAKPELLPGLENDRTRGEKGF